MQSGWAGSQLAGNDLDVLGGGCDLDRLASGRLDIIWTGSPSGGRDLDWLALECRKPIEPDILSAGWIQSGWVRLAGHDLGALIWTC